MSVQSEQPDRRIIGELLGAFRKRNGICLYPDCKNKPINSHVVAEKILKLITEDSTVLTWDLRNDVLVKRLEAHLPLGSFYFEPTSIGIKQKGKAAFPLFCDEHDGPVFAPLEQNNSVSQLTTEQMLLIAYRALCADTYDQLVPERAFSVGEKYGEQSTYSTSEKLPRLNRFLIRDVMLMARQRYEQILLAGNFGQVDGITYLVDVPPCIACTYALVPSDAFDAVLTITGNQVLTIEDVVVISFFPNPPKHSIFVMSWLRGSQRAQVLLKHLINPVPEKEKPDYFLSLGFQAPNVYISPTWWRSLSQEQKEICTKSHLTAGREFAEYV